MLSNAKAPVVVAGAGGVLPSMGFCWDSLCMFCREAALPGLSEAPPPMRMLALWMQGKVRIGNEGEQRDVGFS